MTTTRLNVPIHSLGISQIIAFGLLFYVFAALKAPLAASFNVAEAQILYAVSGSMFLQAVMAPKIGFWIDRFGALYVMWRGLVLGAIGMAILPLFDSIYWLWFCMIPIGIGFAMSMYETAFSAAVQLDEDQARKNISYITFYGGIASSVAWLSIAPLMKHQGLTVTCLILALILIIMAGRIYHLSQIYKSDHQSQSYVPPAFNWGILNRNERLALVSLASSATIEYLVFASTALLWITWFNFQFGNIGLAVILASIYGPFQVVGRIIEMRFGHQFDARLTGALAFICIPISLFLVQYPTVWIAVISMAIFGIGHGILTVTYGFIPNMFFRGDVYGRVKGFIIMPRGVGNAIGPAVGGLLFATGQEMFFILMGCLSALAFLCFLVLLTLKPR